MYDGHDGYDARTEVATAAPQRNGALHEIFHNICADNDVFASCVEVLESTIIRALGPIPEEAIAGAEKAAEDDSEISCIRTALSHRGKLTVRLQRITARLREEL